MSIKNDSKIEIIDVILGRIETANELAQSWQKLVMDVSDLDQLKFLNDLKKRKMIGDIKKNRDSIYILNPRRDMLLVERKRLLDEPRKTQDAVAIWRLSFDENAGTIKRGNLECKIPLNTNQYFLCKKVFSMPFGTRVKEIDILDMVDWAKDSKRSVYDAMLAVNNKVKQDLGVEKLLHWRTGRVWIDEKLPNS